MLAKLEGQSRDKPTITAEKSTSECFEAGRADAVRNVVCVRQERRDGCSRVKRTKDAQRVRYAQHEVPIHLLWHCKR